MKRLRNGVDQQDRFAKIWRFELQGALTAGGSATAKRLDWDGSALASSTDTFTLYAPEIEHPLPSGIQGYAIFQHDAGRWEVLGFFGYGMIQGQLKTAMTSGDSTHTMDNIIVLQGADPRTDPTSSTEEVTVSNLFGWDADDNAVAIAIWDNTNSVWKLLQVQCPA